jgi:hypothetical protein
MSTHRHAAPRRYDAARPPAAVVLVAAVLFLAAFLIPSHHAAGPVTFAPGPRVTAAQPYLAPVAAGPDKAVRHREHEAHVAYLERLHAEHVRHLHHLAEIGSTT